MSRYTVAIYRLADRPLCVAGIFGLKPEIISDGPLKSFLRHLPPSFDCLNWGGPRPPAEWAEVQGTGVRALVSYDTVRAPELGWGETMAFHLDLYDAMPLRMYNFRDVQRLWWLWKDAAGVGSTAYEHILGD